MNWKDIKPSADNSHFLVNGKTIFNKIFIEVLKLHTPSIALVFGKTGAYHNDINGNHLYSERYDRTFGFFIVIELR
jgi:hypothetical protein